jgi:hypothetical protein
MEDVEAFNSGVDISIPVEETTEYKASHQNALVTKYPDLTIP